MASREDIAYRNDVDGAAYATGDVVRGHIVVFGDIVSGKRQILDGQIDKDDIVTINNIQSAVETAVGESTESLWAAVNGIYALAAYGAPAWSSEAEYEEEDYCSYGGNGYRCNSDHTAGSSFSEDSQ